MRSREELERELAAHQRNEQELQHAKDDLENQVQERTKELTVANKELQDQREWFNTTLSSIGDAIIMIDREGRVTRVNQQAEHLTGWTDREATGEMLSTVFRIVDEETGRAVESPATRPLYEEGISGGGSQPILVAKDGAERPVSHSATSVHDEGSVVGCVVVFRDVTERRKAEHALRNSEARLAQLANNISQLVWMADENGWVYWYNERWYEYTGTSLEEVQGWKWQKLHHPDHVERVVEKLRRCFETGDTWEDTFPLRSRDGTYRWFLSRAMPLHDSEGSVERWFGTNTDITEQRETQEELRRLAAELSEGDRRKDVFLATLAHELRNPLAPISMGFAIMRMTEDDPEQQQEVRSTMERQTQQLVALVDDLLDVSRISRAKLELKKCHVELKPVIRDAVDTARPLIDEANHELTVTMPEQVVRLDGDPHRLAQVFANLLTNAAKYTTEGGAHLVDCRTLGTGGGGGGKGQRHRNFQ